MTMQAILQVMRKKYGYSIFEVAGIKLNIHKNITSWLTENMLF